VQKVSRLVPKPSVRCGRPDFEKFTFDFSSRKPYCGETSLTYGVSTASFPFKRTAGSGDRTSESLSMCTVALPVLAPAVYSRRFPSATMSPIRSVSFFPFTGHGSRIDPIPCSRNSTCHDFMAIVAGSLPPTALSFQVPNKLAEGRTLDEASVR